MLKRLKQTWKEEEAQFKKSQSPAPASETAAASPTPTPSEPPRPSEGEPDITQENRPSSSYAPKRSRDTFETDVTDVIKSERPSKVLKIENDSLRNHLPEILDSRERYENQVHLNLSTLKERIFAQATVENSTLRHLVWYNMLLLIVLSSAIADIPATKGRAKLFI
jgi:endoribonuclease Dicer